MRLQSPTVTHGPISEPTMLTLECLLQDSDHTRCLPAGLGCSKECISGRSIVLSDAHKPLPTHCQDLLQQPQPPCYFRQSADPRCGFAL